MTFETDIEQAHRSVKEGYLDLVVSSYTPLFKQLKTKAKKHMRDDGIQEIRLSPQNFYFRESGEFCQNDVPVELRDLPQIYQKHADYIAGCADSRSHMTPDVHTAMYSALQDFRGKLKQSLASVI